MTDHVTRLIEAIDRKDPEGIRAAYATDARLVAMTVSTSQVHEGGDAVTAKMAEWFATWEEEPGYSFLGTVRNGDQAVVEFERTSTFEGAPWVVRQAHVLRLGPEGIREHRMYCCGPREGEPELAAAVGGAS
jgi:ketosteroid isomerase-like protein